MLFYLFSFFIALADQLIKLAVLSLLPPGSSVPIFWILKLTHVQNTGAAFSLFAGFSPYLVVISIFVIAAVIYFHHTLPRSDRLTQAGLVFILGGSLGNFIDRVLRFYVIDYIDITVWPVFNLADIMINLGALLIILRLFLKENKNAAGPA